MFAPVIEAATGRPNERAIAQLVCANVFIYHNATQIAQDALDLLGGGQFVAGAFHPEAWPPSWTVVKQGDTYLIVFAGTTNFKQALLHIGGALGVPYLEPWEDDGSARLTWNVHPLWNFIWSQIKPIIHPVLPLPGQTVRIICTGHSYGGAIATLAAFHYARIYGPASVELMTFGCPRTMTATYDHKLPGSMVRVKTDGDAIPSLGPVTSWYLVPVNFASRKLSQTLQPYGHFGQRYTIYPQGYVTVDQAQESFFLFQPGSIWNTATESVHYISNYLRLIEARWITALGGTQPESALFALAKSALTFPGEDTAATIIHRNDYLSLADANTYYTGGTDPNYLTEANIGSLESITIAAAGTSVRQNSGPLAAQSLFFANILSQGVSMSASGFWKLTLVINNSVYGDSLSIVYKGTSSIADAISRGKQWAAKRATLLGSTHTVASDQTKSRGEPQIEFLRVSDAVNPRMAQLVKLDSPKIFGPANAISRSADVFSTCLTFRLAGAVTVGPTTTVSHANHFIVGQPDGVVVLGDYNGSFVSQTGVSFDDDVKSYLDWLTGANAPIFGFMGQDPAQPKMTADLFTYNNVGRYQLHVVGHGYSSSDRIRITKCNAKGFAGVHRINVVDANNFYLADQLPSGLPLATLATVQLVQKADGSKVEAFYQYQKPAGNWSAPFGVKVSKKNLAREFLGVSFRSRA